MNEDPTLSHDASADVLYAKLAHCSIVASEPFPDDGSVILNAGPDGAVVGLQLLEVGQMSRMRWREHFRVPEIPTLLFEAVDRWLA